MSQRFQFNLHRLFACISALCVAALVLHSGIVNSAGSKCGTPMLMVFMEAWVISGVGIGLLAKNPVAGGFVGALVAIALLVALFSCTLVVAALCGVWVSLPPWTHAPLVGIAFLAAIGFFRVFFDPVWSLPYSIIRILVRAHRAKPLQPTEIRKREDER